MLEAGYDPYNTHERLSTSRDVFLWIEDSYGVQLTPPVDHVIITDASNVGHIKGPMEFFVTRGFDRKNTIQIQEPATGRGWSFPLWSERCSNIPKNGITLHDRMRTPVLGDSVVLGNGDGSPWITIQFD